MHGWIDRTGVRDVKAETGLGQLLEHVADLLRRAPSSLTRILVLQHQTWSEVAIGRELFKRIRMCHDRSHPERELRQQPGRLGVIQVAFLYGRMHAHVAEGKPWSASEVSDQSGKLVLRECRQLNRVIEIRHASATNSGQEPRRPSKTPVDAPMGWCSTRALGPSGGVLVASVM